MPIGAEKVLRSVQPYITGDDTLWHVHELDRIDKHRLVLTTAIALNCWSIVFGPGREITFPETPVPLERGYEVVNVPAPTYHRQAHKGFKLGLDVAFGQSEILAGKPILESLDKMAKFVDGVFARFKPFLV